MYVEWRIGRNKGVSTMRGADVTQEGLFIVRTTSDYVPEEHPLITIREIVNARAARDGPAVRVDV